MASASKRQAKLRPPIAQLQIALQQDPPLPSPKIESTAPKTKLQSKWKSLDSRHLRIFTLELCDLEVFAPSICRISEPESAYRVG